MKIRNAICQIALHLRRRNKMELEQCRAQLAQNGEAIRVLVASVSDDEARWKPSADEWSVLEVVNHLYDEEREDFRQRLDILLHQPPGTPWPPINPGGWVTERGYNGRDLSQSLQNFLAERQKSLHWLDNLQNPDFERGQEHPVAGFFHAGDMLAAWVAHDVLHLRQLVELKWALVGQLVRPYNPAYAGDW
jgi:hypothetical protein